MLRHHVPPGTGADYSDNRYRHLHRVPVARGAHVFGAVAGKAVGLVVSGLAGAVAYDGVKKVARSGAVREAAVSMTTWGLKGARAAETGAEKARLATADIVAEARGRIGEEAPAPGNGHGHGHEH